MLRRLQALLSQFAPNNASFQQSPSINRLSSEQSLEQSLEQQDDQSEHQQKNIRNIHFDKDDIVMSTEQQLIIDNLKRGHVIVDAVAGSGKTTTARFIGKHFPDKSILLLTYSSRLKEDARSKLINTNIEPHSYHSFFHKYYKRCSRDEALLNIINKQEMPRPYDYDILILDELQDMQELYYSAVIYLLNHMPKSVRLCLLGDKYQMIFGYNGADYRFLVLADKIFHHPKIQPLKFYKSTLSTSFRLTHPMAQFINHSLLKKTTH